MGPDPASRGHAVLCFLPSQAGPPPFRFALRRCPRRALSRLCAFLYGTIFLHRKTPRYGKMEAEFTFAETLSGLDLGPLDVEPEEIESQSGADAYLTLRWEGDRVPFVAEFKNARDLRTLQYAFRQARRWADETGRAPLVVVPYLNDDWLAFLRSEGMNGIDLSGNGWIQISGRWSWFQRGFPNRFPQATRARTPYRGRSALVGRVLLARPRFDTVSEVWEEIQRREGSLSLGQVSKVLSALEDDLIVRRGDDGVRLVQPERLLDSLENGYRGPDVVQEVDLRANLDSDFFAELVKRARAAKVRIAGYAPARYVIAPEPGERLIVYVEPRGLSAVGNVSGAEPSRRFANLTIRAIKEPLVFFDTEEEGGFRWCSRLETYLQLMQGGKREREIASPLREDILAKAKVTR